MEHELKADPQIFPQIAGNYKRSEIRRDDREPKYAEGDKLVIRETKHSGLDMAAGAPLIYTGKTCSRIVTHCLRGEEYGVIDGFVSMSIRPLRNDEVEGRNK